MSGDITTSDLPRYAVDGKETRKTFIHASGTETGKEITRLEGQIISRGGRLQLVNSVLSVIPIYFMNCFQIPKWAIQRMDRVRRLFLWGRNEREGRGISLLN